MALKFELHEILPDADRTAYEPRVPRLVGAGSFAFVPTTGMRVAPEVLIVELFREIFYDPFSNGPEAQLSPESPELEVSEKVVLKLARGRLKLTRHGGGGPDGYFAPVFPEQARTTWLRKKTDRTLRMHFVLGALAQALAYSPEDERRGVAHVIVTALKGNSRAASKDDVKGKEILSAAVASVHFDSAACGLKDSARAADDFSENLGSIKDDLALRLPKGDPLAIRIKDDFVALCTLEASLPRLLWLELLKCYLRLAVPAWLLAHGRIATQLRDLILQVVESKNVPSEQVVTAALAKRYEGLFHPTTTGTNELAGHVDRYMKARIELSLLLYFLRARSDKDLFDNQLSVNNVGKNLLTIQELLQKFSTLSSGAGGGGSASLRQSLTRSAESFSAWANPLRHGQGKNIDEFLRALRRFEPLEADSGYLAAGKRREQAVVFPGPTMIRLVLLLAAVDKSKHQPAYRGKLVLADLERHFAEYGLDFSSSSGARPRLIGELARLALLKGSPDAGDFTELLVPVGDFHKIMTAIGQVRGGAA